MKPKLITIAAAFVCTAALLRADAVVPGPQGGRLLQAESIRAEFFVTAERRIEITFYSDSLEPIPVDARTVALVAELADGRTAIPLVKTAHGFVSAEAIPPGDPYRVVVQIRSEPQARPRNFRLVLDLAHCGGCDRAEYACTCEGH